MKCHTRLLAGLLLLSPALVRADEAGPVPPAVGRAELRGVQAELVAIMRADQEGRSQIDAVGKAHGLNSPEMRALWSAIHARDAENLAKLERILAAHGWLGADDVGAEASGAFFYVIQHAGTATQQKYLPVMRQAVQEKKAVAGQLALLEDRVALAEGRPQKYGSQLEQDNQTGQYRINRIEDPDQVDERRRALGLPPMAQYVAHWNLKWDLAAYKEQVVLENELLAMGATSDEGFKRLAALQAQPGASSPEFAAAKKDVAAKNAANLGRIKAMIEAGGWPTAAKVGQRASWVPLQLIQSADVSTQREFLPVVRQALQAKQADPMGVALIEDKVSLEDRGRQIYGSQLERDGKTGAFFVLPIDDPDHVDERRVAYGLPSMADYAAWNHFTWDLEEHKRSLAESAATKH